MKTCIRASLFTLLLLRSNLLSAQVVEIKGAVSDNETGKPVPYASVFLANTTIGSASDNDGTFKLIFIGIPKFELVASSVGYKLKEQSFHITRDTVVSVNIVLIPKITRLSEVIVKPDTTGRAKNYLEFKRLFLGESKDTRNVKILNQNDIYLYFDKETNSLSAKAKEPIKIDNKTLGYSVEYHLEKFDASYRSDKLLFVGIASFKELKPISGPQLGRWTRARRQAYKGSLDHLVNSILNNSLVEERFKVQIVYARLRPSDKMIEDKLLSVGEDSIAFYRSLKTLSHGSRVRSLPLHGRELLSDSSKSEIKCKEQLEVEYFPEESPKTAYFSTVKFLKGKVTVYGNGYFERFHIYTEGYLSRSGKMWTLLPLNYRPEK